MWPTLCLKFSFAWLELQVLKLHGHSHVSSDLQLALEKCLLTKKWENCDRDGCQSENKPIIASRPTTEIFSEKGQKTQSPNTVAEEIKDF